MTSSQLRISLTDFTVTPEDLNRSAAFHAPHQTPGAVILSFIPRVPDSPILRLDPAGQALPDVHGEVVVIQIVHMFQESVLQLLDLLPLAHAA